MYGLSQVGYANLGGIDLSAGSTGNDDGNLVVPAECNHRSFWANLIYRVDNYREFLVEQLRDILRCDEILDTTYFTVGVDGSYSVCHCVNLGLAIDVVHGMYLPVGVGFGHHVEINHSNSPDSGAGQCLDDPGANAADADNTDICLAQTLGSIGTE